MNETTGKGRAETCPRCGATFTCGAGTGACWCLDRDFRLPLPTAETKEQGCYCPDCLNNIAAEKMRDR